MPSLRAQGDKVNDAMGHSGLEPPGGEEAQVVKVTDKNAVLINGHPVALTDAQVRDLIAKATGQRKPKLKRAADIAWNHLTEHDDRDSVSKR